MDLDIDDILADVHRPTYNDTDSFASLASSATLDHQQLTRFWTSERTCPEILPWPTDLMTRVMKRIQSQIAKIEDRAAGIMPSGKSNQNLNLTLSILQTDLSREQFIVRSLLRQRLDKITRYAMHYLTMEESVKGGLLSKEEVQFLSSHQALLGNFYSASFLSAFPSTLQKLDDKTGGVSMVEGPDGKTAVFIRCLAERWSNGVGSSGFDDDDDVDGGNLHMQRGQVWVVRWEDVRHGVRNGHLELL